MPIVPIQSRHKRKAFDCGKPKVNAFLHDKGLAEAYGATWVMVPAHASDDIIGFCTLTPDVVSEDEWDETASAEIDISLEWFGVDVNYQRQGWGEKILFWVISRIIDKVLRYPIAGLILIPLDKEAHDWYMRRDLGFVELDGVYLYLPIETIRHLPYHAIEQA